MYQRTRQKLIVPFLLPQFILFTFITLVPIILTVAYAFTDWQGQANTTPAWAGVTRFELISWIPSSQTQPRIRFFL